MKLLQGPAWSTLARHGAGTRGWATWPLWPLWPLWPEQAAAAAACLTRRTRRSTRGTAVIVAPWLQQIHVVYLSGFLMLVFYVGFLCWFSDVCVPWSKFLHTHFLSDELAVQRPRPLSALLMSYSVCL